MRPPAPERVEIARPPTQPVPVVDLTPEPEPEFAPQRALTGVAPSPAPSTPLPSYQTTPGASVFAESAPAVEETPAIVVEPELLEPEPVGYEAEYHEPQPPAPTFPAEPTLAHPVAPAEPVPFEPAPAPAPVAPGLTADPDVEAEAEEDLERLFWTESEALADLQGGGRSGRFLSRITGSHRKVS